MNGKPYVVTIVGSVLGRYDRSRDGEVGGGGS